MIKAFFQRRRLRKTFGSFLSPQVIDKLLDQTDKPQLKAVSLEFIYVSVQGETPEVIAERMALVSDLAIQHKGMVFDQVSGLILITHGILSTEHYDAEHRAKLCESLQTTLAGNVKIVHGKAQGHSGLLGNSSRMSFSYIHPSFLDTLSTLATLPYGEIREFKDK